MEIAHRQFGETRVEISELCLGTMRLSEKGFSEAGIAGLLESALDHGVTTLHSSTEYSSFEPFSRALRGLAAARRNRFIHVVKLPAPHFREHFSALNLEKRVDEYLSRLDVERLDIVQWMYRREPLDDAFRIPEMLDCANEIEDALDQLRKKGKVNVSSLFPYTPEFAKACSSFSWLEGQINYLNLLELDYADFLNDVSCIALRPLAAGHILKHDDNPEWRNIWSEHGFEGMYQAGLRFPLLHPNVASVVLSVSSKGQLNKAIIELGGGVQPDIRKFDRMRQQASSLTTGA